jgi:hypothetical protein
MPPSLTAEMTVKGPQVLLSTLIKHYFGTQYSDSAANEELLYASGFRLVKVSHRATCSVEMISNPLFSRS